MRPWGRLPLVFMGSALETGAHLLVTVCLVTMAIDVIKVKSVFSDIKMTFHFTMQKCSVILQGRELEMFASNA